MAATEWNSLEHAYGNASDIPGLLKDLSPHRHAGVWDELWSRVCHQGTVYSASFPVLPYLLDSASRWTPTGRVMPLVLAGGIVVSNDRIGVGDTAAYRLTINALHRLSLETLATAEGLPLEDLIYLLAAALALGGDPVWGRQFDRLADGEFEGVCDSCKSVLYLVVGEYGFFATADEWVNRPATPRALIHPAEPSALAGTGAWLHEQAVRAAHPVLAESIRHLFGTTWCPRCDAAFNVAEAIGRAV